VRALLAYKRGEPRVCAMVRAPTPQEEDRRRICRERKTLTAERVEHGTLRGLWRRPGSRTVHRVVAGAELPRSLSA
jgi:transposase